MVLTYLLAVPTMGARPGLGWGPPHRVSGGGGVEEPGPEAQEVWPSAGAVWLGSGPEVGVGWAGAGKAHLILEIKPHAQCPFHQAWSVSLAGWHRGLS